MARSEEEALKDKIEKLTLLYSKTISRYVELETRIRKLEKERTQRWRIETKEGGEVKSR
jgi:hypothetical protein